MTLEKMNDLVAFLEEVKETLRNWVMTDKDNFEVETFDNSVHLKFNNESSFLWDDLKFNPNFQDCRFFQDGDSFVVVKDL